MAVTMRPERIAHYPANIIILLIVATGVPYFMRLEQYAETMVISS